MHGLLDSAARRRTVRWAVAYPPGSGPGADLPLALVLHGRNSDSNAAFGAHGMHRFLAAAVRSGTAPFALASVDGGAHTYWHRRADGDDPQAMLLDELLPLLARHGLRTGRVGLTGWSMGGYGSLLLAAQHPDRVAAVAVDAPALWQRASDTAPGAFDGPDDYARNDVFRDVDVLRSLPVRIGCGASDPFAAADRALLRRLPSAVRSFPLGGHDLGTWNRLRPGDLRFLGRHLAGTAL